MGFSINGGIQNGWFIETIPLKWMIWAPISGNHHIYIYIHIYISKQGVLPYFTHKSVHLQYHLDTNRRNIMARWTNGTFTNVIHNIYIYLYHIISSTTCDITLYHIISSNDHIISYIMWYMWSNSWFSMDVTNVNTQPVWHQWILAAVFIQLNIMTGWWLGHPSEKY